MSSICFQIYEMNNKMQLLILLAYVTFTQCALIIDNFNNKCDVAIEKLSGMDYSVINNTISTGVQFNLRGHIVNENYFACIFYTRNKSKIFFDQQFVEKKPGILRNNSTTSTFEKNPHCELSVEMDCAYSKVPELRKVGICKYKILLAPPPSCGVIIQNKLLDLTPLKRKYYVSSERDNGTTFSINLCGENKDCNDGDQASSCKISNRGNTSISKRDSEFLKYDEKTRHIELKGKYKTGKTLNKLEIIFKCNWFKNDTELHYKEDQSKNYKFEIESWHACVKLPPICEFTEKFYRYNLTGLYNPKKDYEIVTNVSKIYFNVCGPLVSPQTNNYNCSFTQSQICEFNSSGWTSKGRLYTEPVVHKDENHNNVIIMTFIDGNDCNTSKSSYKTTIHLTCSEKEEQPTFVKDENCELHLNWRTPKACPINITDDCSTNAQLDSQSFKCTYTDKYLKYDLHNLYNKQGYSITNTTANEEYLLNVCGPVVSNEAPCKKNSMVAVKNLNENDLRKKLHFYGQASEMYVKNEVLIMETAGGDICENMNTDYKSTIYFQCHTEIENEIRLESKTNCTRTFIWKSKYACPIPTNACTFGDPFNPDFMYDFSKSKTTSLTVIVDGKNYMFDICGDKELACKQMDCTYVPVKRSLVTFQNTTHLEFLLNRPCAPDNRFNRTLFELECDNIQNNDHFIVKKIVGCTLFVLLKTNRVCDNQNNVVPIKDETGFKDDREIIPVEKILDEKNKYDTVERPSKEEVKKNNCIIKNPYTDYTFNISQLNINVSSSTCPEKTFNIESQVISLIYETSVVCDHEDMRSFFNTIVELRCNNNILKNFTETGECFKKFIYTIPEACKLLETEKILPLSTDSSSVSVGAIIGYTFLGIVAAVPVLVLGFCIYKKRSNDRCYESLLQRGYHRIKWIGRYSEYSMPARSPDLIPMIFFFWRLLKREHLKTVITNCVMSTKIKRTLHQKF